MTAEISPQARTRADLHRLHDCEKQSWRTIADLDEYRGISHFTLSAIAAGREPRKLSIRLRLGWPLESYRVVAVGTAIPDGTQAHSAQQCKCGQWFISNHPRRVRCFICSPYRGKKAASR